MLSIYVHIYEGKQLTAAAAASVAAAAAAAAATEAAAMWLWCPFVSITLHYVYGTQRVSLLMYAIYMYSFQYHASAL